MDADRGRTKPYWVMLKNPNLFLAEYVTRSEAEAVRLNCLWPVPPGLPPRYLVMPRPTLCFRRMESIEDFVLF